MAVATGVSYRVCEPHEEIFFVLSAGPVHSSSVWSGSAGAVGTSLLLLKRNLLPTIVMIMMITAIIEPAALSNMINMLVLPPLLSSPDGEAVVTC